MTQQHSSDRFVVSFITRGMIASELNEYIDDCGEFQVSKFEPNDVRLTDHVCQGYANALAGVAHLSEDDSQFEEAQAAALVAILKSS